MQRIPYDATTEEEVIQYFNTRQLQLAEQNYFWDRTLYKNQFGYFINLTNLKGEKYQGFYVLKQDRKKGYSKKLINSLDKILTINDCGVVSFLKSQDKEHIVVNGSFDTLEYKIVEKFYGDGVAKRTGLWFMNHIDEGMIILNHLNKTDASKAGFCLHPLTQDDPNLKANFEYLVETVSSYNLGLSLEYRNIANAYLSRREIKSISEISLSPLQEVNDMLIADKIQNYKDFLFYHKDTHPRAKELDNYFNNWLDKLDCREEFKWFVDFSNQFNKPVDVIIV